SDVSGSTPPTETEKSRITRPATLQPGATQPNKLVAGDCLGAVADFGSDFRTLDDFPVQIRGPSCRVIEYDDGHECSQVGCYGVAFWLDAFVQIFDRPHRRITDDSRLSVHAVNAFCDDAREF